MLSVKRLWFLVIAAAVLAADQVTKAAVIRSIPLGGGIDVTSWFTLTHWRNPGGLFGMLNRLPETVGLVFFLALPLIGLVFLGILFAKAKRPLDLALLSAILGGALGNLVDRVRFGAVVDFLYFHIPGGWGWPAFNVADAFLSTGIIALLVLTLFHSDPEADRASHPVQDR